MTRPFIPNIIITFRLGSGQFSYDPITGNPIQTSQAFEVSAWMEEKVKHRIKGVSDVNVGTNPNSIELRGYAVKPKVLPVAIACSRIEGSAIYTFPSTGEQRTGKFTLKPQVDGNRPYVARRLAKALGTQFNGEFEFT
jgi:hypothetical protein